MAGELSKPWYRRRGVIVLLLLACLAVYLALQTPGNGGPWHEGHERSAYAELAGRSLTIHNIRDFRDDDLQQAARREYVSRTWQLDELERIWFGLSHFGPYGLAHSFISAEFSDGEFLSLSIEARRRPGQVYRPLMGLIRQYTKIYIAATEQDVIGRRSHRRGETVLLYPANGSREDMERFFLALIDDANELYAQPEFYNLILDNCLTNLLKHGVRLEEVSPRDIRVLLPGRTDQLTYAFGITPDDIPFDSARERATIDPTVTGLDDPEFSAKIRCGWSGYAGLRFPACR